MKPELIDSFGKRLFLWFTRRDLTHTQAAQLLNTTTKTLYRYHNNGDLLPPTALLVHIRKAWPTLNIVWLLTGQGTMEWGSIDESENTLLKESEDLARRFSEYQQTLPLLSEAAKAAILPQVKAFADEVISANARILERLQQLEEILDHFAQES